MIYIPILGALLEATGSIIDKKIIKIKKINYKNYSVYGFLSIIIVMIPFIFWFWKLWPNAFSAFNLFIFSTIVITSICANLLMIYALKRESITEIEPIRLMQPLFTILIAFILSFFLSSYIKNRNYLMLVIAIVASLTLILSHVKKHHLKFDKYILAALIGNFLFGLELGLSPLIIPTFRNFYESLSYSFTFYITRCFFIFLICLIIFRPSPKSFPKKAILPSIIVAIIWSSYRIILYSGYAIYGVVFTTILLSILSPIFIYIAARIFLKEKLEKRNIIAAIIIVACVILAIGVEQGWFNFILTLIK